jgi:hypothetical protein
MTVQLGNPADGLQPPLISIVRQAMKNIGLALFLVIITSQNTVAENQLVEAVRSKCVHGLHKQPDGGPFSVFLFCDDALGSNIGVINTAPGAGPGAIALAGPKI